jgi:cytochrome c556
MEMLQVGFLVVGAFILWSSMNLTAPAPVTPNDVTGELNSLLEFIQKIRNKGTPLAHSDRRKQQALDQVFDEAEQTIHDLLKSIEEKGEVMKGRAGTDEVEYKQAWEALTESIDALKTSFMSDLQKIDREFSGMQGIHQSLGAGQTNVKQLIQEAMEKSRDAQSSLNAIYEMYR